MDNYLIYLIYLLVLTFLTLLIWVFIRQGGNQDDPHQGRRNGHNLNGHPESWGYNHQEIEENEDE
jgi:hypothetical protein